MVVVFAVVAMPPTAPDPGVANAESTTPSSTTTSAPPQRGDRGNDGDVEPTAQQRRPADDASGLHGDVGSSSSSSNLLAATAMAMAAGFPPQRPGLQQQPSSVGSLFAASAAASLPPHQSSFPGHGPASQCAAGPSRSPETQQPSQLPPLNPSLSTTTNPEAFSRYLWDTTAAIHAAAA